MRYGWVTGSTDGWMGGLPSSNCVSKHITRNEDGNRECVKENNPKLRKDTNGFSTTQEI